MRRHTAAVIAVALVTAWPSGAVAGMPRTSLVDRNSAGQPADANSSRAAVSSTGRYVAFMSSANNLPGGEGTSDVFVRDRRRGTTRLVSKTSGGDELDGDSAVPDISGSGRFVAFGSDASNLPGARALKSVYVRDLEEGRTVLVNRTNRGRVARGFNFFPSISGSGRFVAFESSSNKLPGRDGVTDIYVRDLERGTTRLVSKTSAGMPANMHSSDAAISANGRYVAFRSTATNLPGRDDAYDVYLHDRETGRTVLVSRTSDEVPADDHSFGPAVSARGRFVAFGSDAPNLPGTGPSDIYVRDVRRGTTRLVSQTSDEDPGNNFSEAPDISGTGRFVAFQSFADNLPGEPGFTREIYVRDRKLGTTEIVSVSTSGEVAQATNASISADGRFIGFESGDPALPAGDDLHGHVYIRGPLA